MLEESVSGVIGAERRAVGGDRDARGLALGINEGEDFAGYIVIVLRLHPAAMVRVGAFVRERIALDAVDGEESDPPFLNVRAKGADWRTSRSRQSARGSERPHE